MKNIVTIFLIAVMFSTSILAQKPQKDFDWTSDSDNIVMTWNKNTPEQEMKDDIKAMAEKGIIVKYNNLKRNDKKEIVALDVSFETKDGVKGSLSYNNKRPIPTIVIHKSNNSVGFGEPTNSFSGFPGMQGFQSFQGMEPFGRQFNFNFDEKDFDRDQMPFQNFNFGGTSKMIIKKDGKKPLVIENGKVIEGGDDYTEEEIEEYKKSMKSDLPKNDFQFFDNKSFNFQEQLDNMQEQINKLFEKNGISKEESELDNSKKELEKAKKELEETKKELEKTKTSLKVKKA